MRGYQTFVDFFKRHERKGRPIKYIIKIGIGGQHTPFQGIADGFQVLDAKSGKIVGEFELGKNYEASMRAALIALGFNPDLEKGWDQIAVIASSKSGSTDESMLILARMIWILAKHAAMRRFGVDAKKGEEMARSLLRAMRRSNLDERGKEKKELFKELTIELIKDQFVRDGIAIASDETLINMLKDVFGHLVFETTNNPKESRLSAFINYSPLMTQLGEDIPALIAMSENVGGRWTGDLHMQVILAFYKLNPVRYWQLRHDGVKRVNDGSSMAVARGNEIVDQGIRRMAVVLPDEQYWQGKGLEQTNNESQTQPGYTTLIAFRESEWPFVRGQFTGRNDVLVLNMTNQDIPEDGYRVAQLRIPGIADISRRGPNDKEQLADAYAQAFNEFYGMVNTIGHRLLVRELHAKGFRVKDVDLNNLDNKATKIVRQYSFLLQHFVELGKGLVDTYFKKLQEARNSNPDALVDEMRRVQQEAADAVVMSTVPDDPLAGKLSNMSDLVGRIWKAFEESKAAGKQFVVKFYLDGFEKDGKFYELRRRLIELGIPWEIEGSGDQHISMNQVHADAEQFELFLVSFVPPAEKEIPGLPYIGFAKPWLDEVSPNLVLDGFGIKTSDVFTKLRGGKGRFVRVLDTPENINGFVPDAAVVAQASAAALSKGLHGVATGVSSLGTTERQKSHYDGIISAGVHAPFSFEYGQMRFQPGVFVRGHSSVFQGIVAWGLSILGGIGLTFLLLHGGAGAVHVTPQLWTTIGLSVVAGYFGVSAIVHLALNLIFMGVTALYYALPWFRQQAERRQTRIAEAKALWKSLNETGAIDLNAVKENVAKLRGQIHDHSIALQAVWSLGVPKGIKGIKTENDYARAVDQMMGTSA